MGTLVGHVLPGLAFLALGLWHLFNNIKLFCLRPNIFYSSVWFPVSKIRYLELYFIMFSSSASISMELFVGPRKHQPFDSDGTIPSNHLHNFEHSFISMSFLVYAVLALVLDRARPRAPASEGLTILAAAAAFSQELLLFHFQSTDHVGFEGQYHLILQLIIFVSLLTTLMGVALPKSFLVSLVRSSSIVFQGVWFIFLGCMLYTPSLIPKGCFIYVEDGHQLVNCSTQEALHRAKALFGLSILDNTIAVVGSMVFRFWIYNSCSRTALKLCMKHVELWSQVSRNRCLSGRGSESSMLSGWTIVAK
ncbi:BnaAnng21030D [Brassica napus]|uniref:BnaAnng21030D protein n=1 Tax=Brassica napus TaxID=3708 RepID=A0A078JDR4_BRANA|nr:BnaAnng21030D [Brassica napus]